MHQNRKCIITFIKLHFYHLIVFNKVSGQNVAQLSEFRRCDMFNCVVLPRVSNFKKKLVDISCVS